DRYTDDYRQFFTNEASRRGQYIVAGSHVMRKDGAYYHCCLGGGPGSPLPNGWARSSIISPCDVPWKNAVGVLAEADSDKEMDNRGAVDLDVLREKREKGAATTFKDRRRRASIYVNWPSHLAVHELAPPVSRY